MRLKQLSAALLILALGAEGASAATTLGAKERARVARAAPRDRAELRDCLIERKKARKKGMVIGGAGVGATTALAGGNLGKSLLGGAVGAVAGNFAGKELGTSKRCHTLLNRYPE